MAKRWLIPPAIPSQGSSQTGSTRQDLMGKVIPFECKGVSPDPIRGCGGSQREAQPPPASSHPPGHVPVPSGLAQVL